MPAYQFIDATGQVVSVNELGGFHVLLHVWASWCGPCLASLPQLKVDIAQWEAAKFIAVGINIDADNRSAILASSISQGLYEARQEIASAAH